MTTSTIKFYKGVTFRKKMIVKNASGTPVDLTGSSARLKVYGGTVFLTLTATGLTTDGVIQFFMSDENTALITFSTCSFQVLLDLPNGDVNLLLAGTVQVG